MRGDGLPGPRHLCPGIVVASHRNNLTELITDGVTFSKGTRLSDGSVLDEDVTVYPSGNIIRQIVPAAQGVLGWNWGIGANAKSQAEELMKSPQYLREYAERLASDERAKFLSALPKPGASPSPNGPVRPSRLRYDQLK